MIYFLNIDNIKKFRRIWFFFIHNHRRIYVQKILWHNNKHWCIQNSTTKYKQYLTYKKNYYNNNIKINNAKTKTIYVQFGIGFTLSMSFIIIKTLIEQIKFYIVQADTFFLLFFSIMNRLKIYLNNIVNIVVVFENNIIILIICRFEHFFCFEIKHYTYTFSIFFTLYSCFFIESKLRKLHKRFEYFSAKRLHALFFKTIYAKNFNKTVLKKLTKYCLYY